MSALLVAARVVHFGSALLLFGGLAFAFGVATPAWRRAEPVASGADHGVNRWCLRVARWSVFASIASGIAWLVAEAAAMSGMPVGEALNRDTLALVLATQFGRVWTLRLGLVIAVAVLLLALGRSTIDKHRSRLAIATLVVAAAYLATLAWSGHAAAGEGSDRLPQLGSDVVHLLAAGAWLGALPGLVFVLGSAQPLEVLARTTRRFSALGVASLSALVISGLANAWYLIGDVPALFGTEYGRLLLAKLALFAAMVVLAVVNRWYLMPRLAGDDRRALDSLRRNAILETAAGIGVVMIVGALGVTVPAAHQPTLWPFGHTLSWRPAQQSGWVGAIVAAAGTLACIAAGATLEGARRQRPRLWIAGLASFAATAATSAWLLAVPAYPTTYLASPVPYTTKAIVGASSLYVQNCGACHGPHGHGDGPAAQSLSTKPTNLVENALQHREGNLFWWIAHGIPGTQMPPFAPRMSDAQIWELIQFLYAQSEVEDAMNLTVSVEPWRPIVAPDFSFELAGQAQETLRQQRGRVTLVVLYTLPPSLPRLRAVAMKKRAFAQAGVRVIAMPISAFAASDNSEHVPDGEFMLAIARPDVATAYTMFAHRRTESGDAPTHVEFLIDRQGYLRARWIGFGDSTNARTVGMFAQIELLNREPPGAPAPDRHGH